MADYDISDNSTSLDGEVWLPIPDYEGIYEASNLGRIKSLDRWHGKRLIKGVMIKPSPDGSGYPQFQLCRDNQRKMVKVHKVVATLFCKANGGSEVNHINFDKKDNRACNLEWVTRQENMDHYKKTGGFLSAINPKRKHKLSASDVNTMRIEKSNGLSIRELSEKFNVSTVQAWRVCNLKNHALFTGAING